MLAAYPVSTPGEVITYDPRSRMLLDAKLASVLILDFAASRSAQKNFPLSISHPVFGFIAKNIRRAVHRDLELFLHLIAQL